MAIDTWVLLILFGGLLGMVGQGIRVAAGMKKLNDTAKDEGKDMRELFRPSDVLISLLIGFVAGALGAIGLTETTTIDVKNVEPATVSAVIAIGYAGTDFIEAFMKKHAPATSG